MEIDTQQKRWQDLGNVLLGAWLFISPWVMDYIVGMPMAAQNSFTLGMAIVVFAAVAIYIPRVWEEWINMALGGWLVISPWILKFSVERDITANVVIVGFLVVALAAWAMTRDKDFKKWWRDHHAV